MPVAVAADGERCDEAAHHSVGVPLRSRGCDVHRRRLAVQPRRYHAADCSGRCTHRKANPMTRHGIQGIIFAALCFVALLAVDLYLIAPNIFGGL